MANILGSGYIPPDTFAYMNNPNLRWMDMSDFQKATNASQDSVYADYWEAHDKFVAQRLINVNNAQWQSNPFNFVLHKAENNLYDNRNAWTAMRDVYQNGGNILAFDTETIGDFHGSLDSIEAQVAGITEIGFAVKQHTGLNGKVNGTKPIDNPAGSFFFGIDSEQKSWLESVLAKKVRGEALTNAEQSAMERASRHSTLGENGFSVFTDTWNGQQYTFVERLNASRPDSIQDIQSGIEAMSALYKSNRDEQIAGLISHIDHFTSAGKHRVVVGQNLAYDTEVFQRYSQMHHIKGLSEGFEYADSMFALRAWASENNTTVAEIIKQYNPHVTNERLGSLEAFIEAITESVGYSQGLAHNAFEDSKATIQVFENNGLDVIQKALSIVDNIQNTPNSITLDNALVKINSQGNIRSQDVLVIDNQVTTGYQTANKYWKFAGVGSTTYDGIEYKGARIADTANKYLARFESTEQDGATLFKAFNSEDEFRTWLTYNTSIFSQEEVGLNGIALQTQIHDRDIARRVIDGFFDVGQVSQYRSGGNTIQAGGFASFQNYYAMYKDLASLSEEAVTSMHLSDVSGKEIKTASDMLMNINTGDNISSIIDYADKHNITSITSHFRTSKASSLENMTAHQAAIRSYDQRIVMQHVFNMFGENQEFFEYANSNITDVNSNLMRTIAFSEMKDKYLKSDSVGYGLLGRFKAAGLAEGYSIDDLNAVSIAKDNSAVRVDVENVDRGARQLFNAFHNSKEVGVQTTSNLFSVADKLKERGLLTDADIKVMQTAHGLGDQPYALAQSIVTHLHNNTQDVRALGVDQAQTIREMVSEGLLTSDQIALSQGIKTKTLNTLINKDTTTLLESSTAKMALRSGTLSDAVKDFVDERISSFKQASIVNGTFEGDNFNKIKSILQGMNYDDASIEDFSRIFYANGKGKSNIARFNKSIGEGQDPVKAIFYRSQLDKTSAFTILTRDKDYAKVMSTLSNLDETASIKDVKNALDGIASYFEIPYLEVFDIGENDTIRKMTGGVFKDGQWQGGHGARATFVKQGDDFYRYDTLSLNMYRDQDGKITGRIKDQGGSYLTSIRQRAESGYTAVSLGEYSSGNRSFNNPNIARMSEEASPQMNGTYDLLGEFKKIHSASQKDIDYAHTIALDPGEGSLGLKDILKELTAQTGYDGVKSDGVSRDAENAIRGIYKAFNEEYKLAFEKKERFTDAGINAVYDSEPFKHFYQRYLTTQTGGIGNEGIIQNVLNGTYNNVINETEREAIRKMQSDSLLQIMSKAVQENDFATDDLRNTLHLLAYDAGLNAVGSESYAHKMMMYVGNYGPQMMNNSRISGQIRPTYTQRANYRGYRLDGNFFDDATEISRRLGVRFGDVYTSADYINGIGQLDKRILSDAGVAVDSAHVSRRNLIGAVQSISDTELQAGREKGLALIRANQDLDVNALEKVYNRMMEDINTYEGKAYVRPSLANQEFFALGDPKNIRLPEIQSIFEMGTETEQKATAQQLSSLIGQRVEAGTVIGKRLGSDGKFKDVVYRGQTINKFTRQNALELMAEGKTGVTVERQLENFKIMFGEEKATAETLAYFTSINHEERAREVIETLQSFGLKDQGSFESNIHLLNQYTDAAMDVITRNNQTGYKTVVIGNNNIMKHLTDMPIDSRWNIIMDQFNSETGLQQFNRLAGDIRLGDNTLLQSHLAYNSVYGTITFDNATDTGSVNVLDQIIERLRTTKNSEFTGKAKTILSTIDSFEKNGIALQSIQRQQMNTFQGQAFKMDQRLYQNLVMQGFGNYNEGEGAKLAELIRKQIQNGYYDKAESIEKIGYKNIDLVWADMVAHHRGTLKPHEATNMLLGTLDAIDYINGKFDVNARNVTRVDVSKILDNIPKTGGNNEAYRNFIFKVDGQLSGFMKANAVAGTNSTILDAGSNSFYLDMSSFGEFEFNDRKMTGILLPYQYINTTDDEIFVGQSTKATIKFLNELKKLEGQDNTSAKISDALHELFKAYGKELDDSDKDSLMTKAFYKMKMPSSSGALARDAIVPTLYYDGIYDDIQAMRSLENRIAKKLDNHGLYSEVANDINALKQLHTKQASALREQKRTIYNATDKVAALHLTSGNKKYAQYLKSFDGTNVIESAITTSKQMFKTTEMDTGRIGWQIVQDYFANNGHIATYDNFSKITEKEFAFTAEEFSNVFFGPKGKEFDSDLSALMRTFSNTKHKEWAENTSAALYDILYAPNLKYQTEFARQKAIIDTFGQSVEKHLKDVHVWSGIDDALNPGLTAEYKREFLGQVNSLFENIGDRYASEVGILGMTGRYPFFTETGTLPVRIYLDDALKGKEVRFLGPQFSILQNLDFDGDTEFLKFLGNGGLLAKNAEEAVLLQHQFNMMNSRNVSVFADSLDDSIKAYRYGDESYFKAKLLEDLAEDKYTNARNDFIGSLTEQDRTVMESLEKEDGDLFGLVLSHTDAMKKQFAQFDEELGSSMSNADMVKAAIQARIAKEYIGNYSKSNLEIRNAMTYMMSLADDKELDTLRQIRNVLFSFDDDPAAGRTKVAPGGLLTILEQQGIDTKHVHDAATLNNSSAWRVGVNKLFNNAKGAPKADPAKQREALIDLIEGSKKVFFKDATDRQSMIDIANEIVSKSFDEWTGTITPITIQLRQAIDAGDIVTQKALQKQLDKNLGKAYLSGLYTMAQMDNAYQGFNGTFRTKNYQDIIANIQNMSNKEIDEFLTKSADLDNVAKQAIIEAVKDNQSTDDAFVMFGRRIREGDLLAYQGDDGPIGYIFKDISRSDKNYLVKAQQYDFTTGRTIGETVTLTQGHSIRELNEHIKEYGNHALLDISQLDTPERNINIRNIHNLSASEIRSNIHGHVAEISMGTRLQDLFDSANDVNAFRKQFDIAISQTQRIPGYSGAGNPSLGRIMSSIIGTDSDAFRRRVIDINERVAFGIQSGMITGSSDAKELIRAINKEIAAHPRENIGRISGNNARDTIQAYLSGTDAIIRNYEFLDRSLNDVILSNQISQEIESRIASRNTYVEGLAKNFYNNITNGANTEQAFQDTQRAWQAEIDSSYKSIMDSIRRSSNAEEEMMYRFGWNNIAGKDNFIIDANSAILKEAKRWTNADFNNARVGFGQFTGLRMKDMTYQQQRLIQHEIEQALPNLETGSLEWIAATNTDMLLKSATASQGSALDFTNAETLRSSYRSIFNPDAATQAASQAAQESMKESAAQAARQTTENVEKKTLLKELKQTFQNISPEAGRYFKIGAGIAGGAAAIGLVGHALFNNTGNQDVEVPASVERSLNTQGVNIKNKNDLQYENAPTQAQSTQRQHRIAPPSLPKNRTIYHDAGSGFNFKVTAQSYNKLQAESYQRMMQGAGLNNNSLHVTKDNSKITDNWLANKFAQLTE
jgi:hypothetical protein